MRGTLSGNQEHCHRHSSKTLLTHFHNVPTLCVSTCSATSPTISLFLNREERHLSRPRSWLSYPSRQPCTRTQPFGSLHHSLWDLSWFIPSQRFLDVSALFSEIIQSFKWKIDTINSIFLSLKKNVSYYLREEIWRLVWKLKRKIH